MRSLTDCSNGSGTKLDILKSFDVPVTKVVKEEVMNYVQSWTGCI